MSRGGQFASSFEAGVVAAVFVFTLLGGAMAIGVSLDTAGDGLDDLMGGIVESEAGVASGSGSSGAPGATDTSASGAGDRGDGHAGTSAPPIPTASPAPADSRELTSYPAPRPADNPWGTDTVVVAISNPAEPDRDVRPLVAEALRYWNRNAGTYGAYDVRFVLDPGSTAPDIVIHFRESVTCEPRQNVSGCAPVLEPGQAVQRPAHVNVTAGQNDRSTVLTLKHELGHVVGITHCEEPLPIMGLHCQQDVARDATNATDRDIAWLDTTLRIAIDWSTVPTNERAETHRQLRHAVAYWNDGAGGGAPDGLRFRRVDEPLEADIVIRFGSHPACPGGPRSCGVLYGKDYDNDGEHEYYTHATIVVNDIDPEARGWHVGYWLGVVLGADSTADLPSPFRTDDHDHRRSDWWADRG